MKEKIPSDFTSGEAEVEHIQKGDRLNASCCRQVFWAVNPWEGGQNVALIPHIDGTVLQMDEICRRSH